MDPSRLRACEALTKALAKELLSPSFENAEPPSPTAANNNNNNNDNNNASLSLPNLSTKQVMLNIPEQLVYLYSLVVRTKNGTPTTTTSNTDTTNYTAKQQTIFADLQRLYQQEQQRLLSQAKQQSKIEKDENTAQKEENDKDDERQPSRSSSSSIRVFQLSPNLAPSSVQDVESIEQDVQHKIKELERKAENTRASLVQEELAQTETTTRSNKHENATTTGKKQKSQQSNSKKTKLPMTKKQNGTDVEPSRSSSNSAILSETTTVTPNNHGPSPSKSQTLQEVLQQRIRVPRNHHHHQDDERDESNEQQWIHVDHQRKKKPTLSNNNSVCDKSQDQEKALESDPRKMEKEPTMLQMERTAEVGSSNNAEMTSFDQLETNNGRGDHQVVSTTETTSPGISSKTSQLTALLSVDASVFVPSVNKQIRTAPNPVPTHVASNSFTTEADQSATATQAALLQQRVLELEQRLATKEQELQRLKEEHAQQLHRERDQADERFQALQLRLYISETKLKTYEDALEDHVRAVATNTCSSTSIIMPDSSGQGDGRSPMRRGKQSSTEKSETLEESLGKRPWASSSNTNAA